MSIIYSSRKKKKKKKKGLHLQHSSSRSIHPSIHPPAMYHPSRGGVRGGRDKFNWDDVKTDKHRENYLGHSVKAPVGRWQKGKDLTWYATDKSATFLEDEAAKAEIRKIKEEEEQAMREVLGLAPMRQKQFQGNRLDKHETAELLKRGKTEEDLLPDYAKGERIQGLGFAPAPKHYTSGQGILPQSNLTERMTQPQLIVKHNAEASSEEEPHVKEDHVDSERQRKLEKKEAKERRKEERRAAKKEKRKYGEDEQGRSHHDRKHGKRRHGSKEKA